MRVIKPSYEIMIQPAGPLGVLQHIEKVARVCYKSEDKITEDGESAIKMCNNLISRSHEAMIEHSSYIIQAASYTTYQKILNDIQELEECGYDIFLRYTFYEERGIVSGNARAWIDFFKAYLARYGVMPYYSNIFLTEDIDKNVLFGEFQVESLSNEPVGVKFISKEDLKEGIEKMVHYDVSVKFIVDRGVSHELVRHRIASFGQESTRYCNYGNEKFGNGITVIDICGGIILDNAMMKLSPEVRSSIHEEWCHAMEDAERHYLKMIELGSTAQIARSVLPNSTKTEITMTSNLREWNKFFGLRVPVTAHPQMREVTYETFDEFKQRFPTYMPDVR
jgi:thymidylate synthase (FAD)